MFQPANCNIAAPPRGRAVILPSPAMKEDRQTVGIDDIPIQAVPPLHENPVTTGCEQKEPFVLRVLGDSMTPEFNEGDVITIEPGREMARDGGYVLALHRGEYIFRQLVMRGEQGYLQPLNPAYEAEPLESLDSIKGVISQKKAPGGGRKGIKRYL